MFIPSHPILWFEEPLLLPPTVPCCFNKLWAVRIRHRARCILFLSLWCWNAVRGCFSHFLLLFLLLQYQEKFHYQLIHHSCSQINHPVELRHFSQYYLLEMLKTILKRTTKGTPISHYNLPNHESTNMNFESWMITNAITVMKGNWDEHQKDWIKKKHQTAIFELSYLNLEQIRKYMQLWHLHTLITSRLSIH